MYDVFGITTLNNLMREFLTAMDCKYLDRNWDDVAFNYAIANELLDLFMDRSKINVNPYFNLFDYLATVGCIHANMTLLHWAKKFKKNNDEWTVTMFSHGAIRGSLRICKWLLKQSCPIDTKSFLLATCEYGHLRLLKWAVNVKKMKSLTTNHFHVAMIRKHYHVAKWLISQRCPIDDNSCCVIIASRDVEILNELKSHDMWPFDKRVATSFMYNSVRLKNIEFIKWGIDHCHSDRFQVCQFAILRGDLDILKWVYENTNLFDRESCLDYALISQKKDIYSWIMTETPSSRLLSSSTLLNCNEPVSCNVMI